MRPPIAFTGLVLETPRLDETVVFYADQFGLAAGTRDNDEVQLAALGAPRPPLTLRLGPAPRLVELAYAYPDEAALAQARAEAEEAGLDPANHRDGFAVRTPDRMLVSFAVGSDASVAPLADAADRPLFLSHAVVNSRDPERLVAFFRDRLGFRVSDRYEKGLLTFLKCDQPQHHCLGIAPADVDGLNHFAMDTGTIDALMRGLSRMKARGHEPVWGPGRHGPGGNVFCYFEDPSGFVPEYTCEVLQIADDAAWQPTEWQRTPENGNVWLTGGPSPRAAALMSGVGLPGHAEALAERATTGQDHPLPR